MTCGEALCFSQRVSPTESATNGFRFAPISTGLRFVISSLMMRTISGEIFIAELWNEMVNPVVSDPEYSNGTPVTVFPDGTLAVP